MRAAIFSVALGFLMAVGASQLGLWSTRPAAAAEPYAVVDVITGLSRPIAMEVAPTGDVFVVEKEGRLKAFDNFDDKTPDLVLDWNQRVMSPSDQGMLGLAVDPLYGSGRDYIYMFYTRDDIPFGSGPPYWNDTCTAATTDGCVVRAHVGIG